MKKKLSRAERKALTERRLRLGPAYVPPQDPEPLSHQEQTALLAEQADRKARKIRRAQLRERLWTPYDPIKRVHIARPV